MSEANSNTIFTQNIVACIWDFDCTLIRGYMQQPIFDHYKVDANKFWAEANELPAIYKKRGIRVSPDTIYLNHLISYIMNGPLKGLNNAKLHELGAELEFFPGLPDFFQELKNIPQDQAEFKAHDITLEHYIISNGLAEMIRGSKIAPHVETIFGCELIENPSPPGFNQQSELDMNTSGEISQIGFVVDNTIKTRFVFEINKGSNKNPEIDVNSYMEHADRRIPIRNMVYIADGPSDVPVFSVISNGGGKTYAVYEQGNQKEFAQNDTLLQTGRINSYGPADYKDSSSTHMWLKMHITEICERIVENRKTALSQKLTKPPQHLHDESIIEGAKQDSTQEDLFKSK